MAARPIDYSAARRTLVRVIAAATGLEPGHIVRAQAQGPVQPMPKRPYATFLFRSVAMRSGFRDHDVAAPEISETASYSVGLRGIAIDVNFYADDQDDAYGLACALQCALFGEMALQSLRAGGFSVWQVGDVTDVTALLNTGYEGRALLDFQLWTSTELLFDPGPIEAVPLLGNIHDGLGQD